MFYRSSDIEVLKKSFFLYKNSKQREVLGFVTLEALLSFSARGDKFYKVKGIVTFMSIF